MSHDDAFSEVLKDQRFIHDVKYWLQRPLSDYEEFIAFDMRNTDGYGAQEVAEAIRVNARPAE